MGCSSSMHINDNNTNPEHKIQKNNHRNRNDCRNGLNNDGLSIVQNVNSIQFNPNNQYPEYDTNQLTNFPVSNDSEDFTRRTSGDKNMKTNGMHSDEIESNIHSGQKINQSNTCSSSNDSQVPTAKGLIRTKRPNPIDSDSDQKRRRIESKEYTIILLGESGVGKSTAICSIENYLKYPTFDEAKKNNMKICLPLKFKLFEQNGTKHVIECDVDDKKNDDNNENFNDIGQSVTQNPKIYKFEYNGDVYKFIDTPGLSDTRGKKQDEINLNLIRQILKKQKEIHGICIVLRSNDARFTSEFELSTRRLLSLFPKKALNNIFFFFTFSAGTFFAIGDSGKMLQQLHERIKYSHQESFDFDTVTSKSCCVDSESFKYLLGKERNIICTNRNESSYEYCWNSSANSVTRFVTFLHSITPIKLEEILKIDFLLDSSKRLITEFNTENGYNNDDDDNCKHDIQTLLYYVKQISLPGNVFEFTLDKNLPIHKNIAENEFLQCFENIFKTDFNDSFKKNYHCYNRIQ